MNVRNHKVSWIIGVVLLCATLFSACDKLIYTDMAECPRGVYINIYSQTECASQRSVPEAQLLNIYTFDKEGKYVEQHKFAQPNLTAEGEVLVSLPNWGRYSFVVWVNNGEELFDFANLVPNSTTKDQLLQSLKKHLGKAADLKGRKVYVGSTNEVEVGIEENLFAHTSANVREITNRIEVTVKGIKEPEKYTIVVQSANLDYAIDGNVLKAEVATEYPTEVVVNDKGLLEAHFTTLKLESGRKSRLIVKEIATGTEIFNKDLVGAILLAETAGEVNTRCDNDYTVRLEVKECGCPEVYEAESLWIADWGIHSYDIYFGQLD